MIIKKAVRTLWTITQCASLSIISYLLILKMLWRYVYGRRFSIVSNHSPLQQIIKKDIIDTITQLQWVLLQCHDWIQERCWDTHIRLPLKVCAAPSAQPRTSQIGTFEVTAAKESDIHTIRSTQKKDPLFQELERLCQEVWPEHHNQVPSWPQPTRIAVIDGILVKSQRIRVLRKIRQCLLRARDKWFWPGMSEHIRRLILTCPSCLEHQPRQKQSADSGLWHFPA